MASKKGKNQEVDLEKIMKEAAQSFSKESTKILKEIQKKNESQRKLMENRNKAKTKEDKDRIDDIIDENARKIRELMEEYNSGVASFWDEWTDQEKEAFSKRSDMLDDSVKETEEAIDKIRGRLISSIEEVSEEVEGSLDEFSDSFSDRMRDISEQLREWSNALNLTALVDSTRENLDSYMDNIRQMRVATGDWFDEKGFNKATTDLVKQTLAYNRSESSEFISTFMNDFGLKQMEQAGNYTSELAAATKAFGNSIEDYENLMWKDSNAGYQGRLVRQVNNMAATLEDNKYLNVKADGVISKINENIDTIIGLHGEDAKKQKGLIKSVAAIEAVQQSAAVEGVGTISEKLLEWSKMSLPELQRDESFTNGYMAATGIDAKTFYEMAAAGKTEDLYMSLYDSLNSMAGTNEYARQYNLDYWTQALDTQGYADLNSFLSMDRNSLKNIIEESEKSVAEGLTADGSLATDKTQESLTKLDELKNLASVNAAVTGVSDFITKIGLDDFIKLSDLANMTIIASGGMGFMGNIFKGVKFGKAGTGFGGKMGGFFKGFFGFGDEAAVAAASAEKAAKSGGLFSKITGLFKRGSKGADDIEKTATKGKFFSKMKSFFKVGSKGADDILKGTGKTGLLGKLGNIFKNTKTLGVLGKLGKVIGKAGGPLAALFAFLDGISGFRNSKKWTGGIKLSDKISSFLGGVIGGTGPGIGEKGSIGSKLLNMLGGAGKGAAAGAAVGSVIPVVGTLIGGIVGSIIGTITAAIGGDRIAKFFKSVGGKITLGFTFAGNVIGKSGQRLANKVDEWKTFLSDKWKSFGESISSWKDKLTTSFKSLLGWFNGSKLTNWIKGRKDNPKKKKGRVKGYAKGLSEVPFDNFPALLHEGESVLTEKQAKNLKKADGGLGFKNFDKLNFLLEALEDSDLKSFSKMSIPELMKNKDFMRYSAMTGIDAKTFYEKLNENKMSLDSFTSMSRDDFSKMTSSLMDEKLDKVGKGAEEDLLSVVKDLRNKLVKRFLKEDKDLSRMIRNFNENGLLGGALKGGATGILSKLTKGIFGSSGLGKDISNLLTGKGTGGSLMTRLKQIFGGDKKKKSSSSTAGTAGTEGGTGGSSGSGTGLLSFHKNIEGSGAERWRPYTIDALKANDLKSGKSMQNKVIKQIKSESGGDPKAVNASSGAAGLLQTMPSTFKAHAFSGHSNIYNGYDNMLAAIDYAKKRYGKNLVDKNGNGLGSGKAYAEGTPFVPSDQVALIHQGEMIVPASQNPMNNPTATVSIDRSGSSDNTQVIETMKWQVSRLEGKLDRLISAVESKNKRRMPREASDELNEAFSSVKRPGMGVL